MRHKPAIRMLSDTRPPITLTDPKARTAPGPCDKARELSGWIGTFLRPVHEHPSRDAIGRAKRYLLDKYLEAYHAASRAHRTLSRSTGHVCIFAVFLGEAELLSDLERSLPPEEPARHAADRPDRSRIEGLLEARE